MAFPTPDVWHRDTADARRDERKRGASPTSYFFTQGQSLVLAASYFSDDRLAVAARGGVALKHRHRIQLALFGQLMASFEYMLKDFVAKEIDASTLLDERILKEKWIGVDTARILAVRNATSTPGAMLVHASQGWHAPRTVNDRYVALFDRTPISNTETSTLDKLWVLRHSVAHNAGYVTQYDATRIGSTDLQDDVANVDAEFIRETFEFLRPIARRVADIGNALLISWLHTVGATKDFERDRPTYQALKQLSAYVESRTRELPEMSEATYEADFDAAQVAN